MAELVILEPAQRELEEIAQLHLNLVGPNSARKITDLILDTLSRLEMFYEKFKTLWFKENKPFGWEIQDARLGGLILRIRSCADRLEKYVEGKISAVEELEENILSFGSDEPQCNVYCRLISRSEI